MAKRGRAAVVVCSSAFTTLGRAQATALGNPALPIAVIPHPFGNRTGEEVRQIAELCLREILALTSPGAAIES